MAWRHPLNDVAGYGKVFAIAKQIRALEEKLAAVRAKTAGAPVKDYELTVAGGKKVKLARLFGGKQALILIHNMGRTCPYCTMWADGFSGDYRHLAPGAAFVLVSNDPPALQKKQAASRGWRFPMASAQGTTLFRDLGFADAKGNPFPGVTTLIKGKDGKIRRHASAPFGPGDKFCGVWSFAELLPPECRPQ